MADLHGALDSMRERMSLIVMNEHGLGVFPGSVLNFHHFTFQELCNIYMREEGTINSVDYSGIGIHDYTPEEAFAIIRHKADIRSKDLTELINEMGPYGAHEYTAKEALNKKADVVVGTGT
tara:strand:+ start:1242 stop:1604 length:363 start_codon:yes stop_codon:yes gene_type:complete